MISSSDSGQNDPAPGTFSTLATPAKIRLDRGMIHVNAVRGTTGQGVRFTIANVGGTTLKLSGNAFGFTGPDRTQFIVNGTPRNIPAGRSATFYVSLRADSDAPLDRVLTATLNVTQTGRTARSASLAVRGLATAGEGGSLEPSLARILQLYEYDIDVGDASPQTTFLDLDGGATDQIFAQRFQKARNGFVTIEPLAQFVPKTATVAGRIGTYEPGTPENRRELFSLNGIVGQGVSPNANGSTSFDPGTRAFGLFAEAPTFIDDTRPRQIFSEDALNTFEPSGSERGKVRVYPLREDGATVADAYVVAFEEYELENDQNDYVFVIRNVAPLKSLPEIGLIALDGQPDPDRLMFSRIQNPNTTFGNGVHDVSTVRVVNTGNKDLVISSISIDGEADDDFEIVGAPITPVTLRRSATLDLTVRFIADDGDRRPAILSIASNDRDEPTKRLTLSGFWQSHSETNPQGVSQEPTLQEIFDTFGFRTRAAYDGQEIDGNGATEAIGDEVLADAWAAADPAKPVSIQEIAGFHSVNTTDQVAWYRTGSPFFGANDPRNPGATNGPRNALYDTNAADGQTFFQRKANSTEYARAAFLPGTSTFGLRVGGEYSDDEINNQTSGDEGGHHFRFYPARDERYNTIPDAYLVAMDFSSINFDYNDHVFLVRNIRPDDRPAAVTGLTGTPTSAGNAFDWADVAGAGRYAVLRSDAIDGTYARISPDVLGTSSFVDTTAPTNQARYYRVVALASDGEYGQSADLALTRRNS